MTKPRFDKPPAAAAERLGVWSSHKEFPSREPGGHASPARSRSRGSEGTAPPRRGGAPRDHGAPGALTRLAVQRVAQQGQSGGPFGDPGSAPSPGCSCSADRGQRKQFQL